MFQRAEKLRELMAQAGIDAALFSPSADLYYLTGIRSHLMERLSCVLITQEDIVNVAPGFEVGNVAESIRSQMTVRGWNDGEDPFAILAEYLPKGEKNAVICPSAPSWILLGVQALRPNWNWSNASGLLKTMRVVKDDSEKAILADVARRSNNALLKLLEHGVCGLTELQAARLLSEFSAKEGLNEGMPIVAFGPNSALPHHMTDDTPIEAGGVLLIDYGGVDEASGYYADTTRTYAVKSEPDGLREIYDIVNQANTAAFEAAKPGIACEDVDRAAREVIEKAGYGEYFTHRLGHGLGLEIHEDPYMTTGNKEKVQAGNVFSDEPGIYLPGRFGVRIEDLLFINPDGAERLTVLDHDLHVID